MNEEIETLFKDFSVPVSYMNDDTQADTYITYQQISSTPALEADDTFFDVKSEYDFDIFSKGNFMDTFNAMKELLLGAGWTWVEDGPDMYEPETKYFHKTATFAAIS